MKKHIFLLSGTLMAVLINSASLAQAQKQRGLKNVAEMQTTRMEVILHLSGEQICQVNEINLQYLNELGTACDNLYDDGESLTEAKLLRLLHERNNALKNVLSEDQMSAFLLLEPAALPGRGTYPGF